jgi:hypothetical protein
MASEYNGKSSGTTTPKIRKYYDEVENEKDWDFKFDDLEIDTQEVELGDAASGNDARRLDPVTDLKHRLSMWGMWNYSPTEGGPALIFQIQTCLQMIVPERPPRSFGSQGFLRPP